MEYTCSALSIIIVTVRNRNERGDVTVVKFSVKVYTHTHTSSSNPSGRLVGIPSKSRGPWSCILYRPTAVTQTGWRYGRASRIGSTNDVLWPNCRETDSVLKNALMAIRGFPSRTWAAVDHVTREFGRRGMFWKTTRENGLRQTERSTFEGRTFANNDDGAYVWRVRRTGRGKTRRPSGNNRTEKTIKCTFCTVYKTIERVRIQRAWCVCIYVYDLSRDVSPVYI